MPALSRAVLLGLKAAALVSLVGPPLAPSPALASPIPFPAPLMPHIADYAAQPPARTNATAVPQAENIMLAKRTNVVVVSHTTPERSPLASREGDMDTNILDNINVLGNMYSAMSDHSSNLSECRFAVPIVLLIGVSRPTCYQPTYWGRCRFQSACPDRVHRLPGWPLQCPVYPCRAWC